MLVFVMMKKNETKKNKYRLFSAFNVIYILYNLIGKRTKIFMGGWEINNNKK